MGRLLLNAGLPTAMPFPFSYFFLCYVSLSPLSFKLMYIYGT